MRAAEETNGNERARIVKSYAEKFTTMIMNLDNLARFWFAIDFFDFIAERPKMT